MDNSNELLTTENQTDNVEQVERFKTCFIITPIGNENSETRRHADGVIQAVIKPLLINEFKFTIVDAAHDISKSGSINNQVMSGVLESDLVIANLSGLNPNVMYELAVRHATQKPIIHICEKETTVLPFDIADQRTIFYKNDMLGVKELENTLRRIIKSLTPTEAYSDNPIYNAKKQSSIIAEVSSDKDYGDIMVYMINRLDSIEKKQNTSMIQNNYTIGDYKNEFSNDFTTVEEFNIAISVDDKFDEALFTEEVVSKVKMKFDEVISLKLKKSVGFQSWAEFYYKIVIGTNSGVPTVSDIEEILKTLFYNQVTIEKIDGNEIPF